MDSGSFIKINRRNAIATAVDIIDKFLHGEWLEMPLKEIDKVYHALKQQEEDRYIPIKNLIQEDIERRQKEEVPELYFLPDVVLWIIEKLHQENLAFFLATLCKKIEKEPYIVPSKTINNLKTDLSENRKQEIFEDYTDPLTTDYIRKPIKVGSLYYDTVSFLKMMVIDRDIRVNLEGTHLSFQVLNNLREELGESGIDELLFLFIPNAEPGKVEVLYQALIKNVLDRQHSPQEWQELLDNTAMYRGLPISIKSRGFARLAPDTQNRLMQGNVRLNDLVEGLQEMMGPKNDYWDGSLEELKKLMEDKETLIKPKILQDLKYIGFTGTNPYTRVPLSFFNVRPVSKDYWDNLNQLVKQVQDANNIAETFQKNRKAYVSKTLKNRPIAPLYKFYRALILTAFDMVKVCNAKQNLDDFESQLEARFQNVHDQLDAAQEIQDNTTYLDELSAYKTSLLNSLNLLKRNAPQIVLTSKPLQEEYNLSSTRLKP